MKFFEKVKNVLDEKPSTDHLFAIVANEDGCHSYIDGKGEFLMHALVRVFLEDKDIRHLMEKAVGISKDAEVIAAHEECQREAAEDKLAEMLLKRAEMPEISTQTTAEA